MELNKDVKLKVSTIRARTWTMTGSIIIALIFYLVVNITLHQDIDFITFGIIALIQILVHCAYFPDGDLFGQRDGTYILNHDAYNDKAETINHDRKITRLREFCDWEYKTKCQRYIENVCGQIGIDESEYEILKQKSIKELKSLSSWEYNGKLIFFTKRRKKMLYNLIFKPLPVEKNKPETIMSAVENDWTKALRDKSQDYKVAMYVMKIFKATVLGLVFAMIGYTVRDGFGLAEIAQLVVFLATLFITAVMSFASGEKTSKVFKSQWYLELSNYIDEFNEWDEKNKKNIENNLTN